MFKKLLVAVKKILDLIRSGIKEHKEERRGESGGPLAGYGNGSDDRRCPWLGQRQGSGRMGKTL